MLQNDVEFPVVFKNTIKSDEKYICSEVIAILKWVWYFHFVIPTNICQISLETSLTKLYFLWYMFQYRQWCFFVCYVCYSYYISIHYSELKTIDIIQLFKCSQLFYD